MLCDDCRGRGLFKSGWAGSPLDNMTNETRMQGNIRIATDELYARAGSSLLLYLLTR